MGMSEEEFWNSDPIFFNECYEVFHTYNHNHVYEVLKFICFSYHDFNLVVHRFDSCIG